MTLWEFAMTAEGYKLANGGGDDANEPKAPSEDAFFAAVGPHIEHPVLWVEEE
jgi:hypothetical protein